jgi:hypothetical protein
MAKGIKKSERVPEIAPAVSLGELIHAQLRGAIEAAVHEELAAALEAAPYEPSGTRRGRFRRLPGSGLVPRLATPARCVEAPV